MTLGIHGGRNYPELELTEFEVPGFEVQAFCKVGTRHRKKGQATQDAIGHQTDAARRQTLFVVNDGVGSHRDSDLVAELHVEETLKHFATGASRISANKLQALHRLTQIELYRGVWRSTEIHHGSTVAALALAHENGLVHINTIGDIEIARQTAVNVENQRNGWHSPAHTRLYPENGSLFEWRRNHDTNHRLAGFLQAQCNKNADRSRLLCPTGGDARITNSVVRKFTPPFPPNAKVSMAYSIPPHPSVSLRMAQGDILVVTSDGAGLYGYSHAIENEQNPDLIRILTELGPELTRDDFSGYVLQKT
ncbi:hypothetical protein HOD30_04535 [Candidatus Peregrinibacteria bacterium]|jgi:hypothetical protein|nr:hypothetical protein [Candidatus Peregrinibacteria bacterium]MBT4632182.1 hypothetical protein [Candidatus Peregrinibacteria bacterium]